MHGEGILFFENDYQLNKTIEIFNNIIQNPIEIINDIEICTRNILKGDFSNIKRYKGNFANNNKEGFGTCNYKNGACYIGEWKNDKYDGNGTFFKKNGEYIEGKWKNGKKNGHMILFDRYQNKLDEADFYEDNIINDSSSLIPQIKLKFLCLNI